MKKLLLSLLITFTSLFAGAQNLQNSIWFGTHPPSPNLYFKFGNDTLFYSTSGGSYTTMSKFTASAGQMAIFDIMAGSLCSDTGHYSYSIASNILSFQAINDICSSRRNTLVNYTWHLVSATGINELSTETKFSISPNPAENGITKITINNFSAGNNMISIFDLSGRMVFSQPIYQPETTLDLAELPQSSYILKFSTKNSTTSSLFVK